MIERDVTGGTRYRLALQHHWADRKGAQTIGASLTDYRDAIPLGARVYIDTVPAEYGGQVVSGGFIVKADGELVGVWSARPGRGDALLDAAIREGATHLDCFDGYLPLFYARHGFRETAREANWTPDGPDVVYMEHAA